MKVIVAFAFLFLAETVRATDELNVEVQNGDLHGKYMETKNGRTFRAFMGIPYAKPPIGHLRFEPPVAAEDWDDIKDATKDSPMCIQKNIFVRSPHVEGQEDCLYLNVYTQEEAILKEPLPVMVFIHGGGFHCGSGNAMMYPPNILMDRDVILVGINYRLGPLGFLSTGDAVVPGNNGMKDQSLALKWVRDNIAMFGGDPNSVTIFGESAGAGSSNLHMISPLSKGLFHAAISQSGSAQSGWALHSSEEGAQLSHKLAKLMDCSTKSSKAMVLCLRKSDAADLMATIDKFAEWDIEPPVVFRPVVEPKHEDAFLSDTLESALKKGIGSDVPWIVGLNADEGAMRAAPIYGQNLIEDFSAKFQDIVHLAMFDKDTQIIRDLAKTIKSFYFGDAEVLDESHKQAVVDFYTDVYFSFDMHDIIQMHMKYNKQPVYVYLFGYRGSSSFTEVFAESKDDYGVCHGDELYYLFPTLEAFFPTRKSSASDKKMMKVMTTLWTNFAKYGNPTPNNDLGTIWKPVKTEANEFLFINHDILKMDKNMFSKRIAFWEKLKKLMSKHALKEEL